MPGPRLSVDELERRGKKHLTKAEAAERRAAEVKVDKPKTAKPPKWLPEGLKADFRKLGKQLIAAGIYTDLDADTLGRYLVAHRQWLMATQEANRYLAARDAENADQWSKTQERYFKQCRNCANDMGLTVTSRCRLAIPESNTQKTEDNNPFLELIQGGLARDA